MRRTLLLSGLLLLAATAVRAEALESDGHAAWESCLRQSFAARSPHAAPARAAAAAITECRAREDAYIVALSASPLLDREDVARIRPALVERARFRLLGQGHPRIL